MQMNFKNPIQTETQRFYAKCQKYPNIKINIRMCHCQL